MTKGNYKMWIKGLMLTITLLMSSILVPAVAQNSTSNSSEIKENPPLYSIRLERTHSYSEGDRVTIVTFVGQNREITIPLPNITYMGLVEKIEQAYQKLDSEQKIRIKNLVEKLKSTPLNDADRVESILREICGILGVDYNEVLKFVPMQTIRVDNRDYVIQGDPQPRCLTYGIICIILAILVIFITIIASCAPTCSGLTCPPWC